MDEDFGADIITISDEDGNEYELEVLDTVEHNGITYMALVSTDPAEAEKDELIILKKLMEDGEETLSTTDDDDEEDELYNLFMDRLYDANGDGSEGED